MEIDYENVGDDIDLKDLENEAWLIKLPAYLFDKWADVADDDTELARVQFFVDSRGIELLVDDNVADTYLFYQYKDDGSVSMAATAKKNFIVKPTFGVDYSRKVRQRTLQAATSMRGIKIIGDNENHGTYVPPGAYAAAITKFGNLVQKKPKVSINQKTTRMPKNELIDLLFGAFEKYTYWTLRGLKDYAKQPESYLKDVLNEIAILDKRGSYNNYYHLKPEYSKQSSNASDIAPLGLEAPAIGTVDDDFEFENDNDIEYKLESDDENLFEDD
ncbi:hypothetical protein RhiirA4_506499 [Rhizophagus irregularis]|uniref:Transcription initiation factor IIF subunit beta n=1 Tax=Rhizophagus irregularis TaxID=588596 RepID=A0A2I1HB62_9GLOM|nr:hypothetical protein RhiirA4_506499 [Rhizophagus irregularis]